MCSLSSPPVAPVRSLPAGARITAIADAGSVAPVSVELSAPRASKHLARFGIRAQDDDGIVLARATLRGHPVLLAAQDERFVGGSAGANHADALRRLFEVARDERPFAVVLLAASGGVRLHEANPAELALARALRAMGDLRASGVPVLALGIGDVFGGVAVLACAADRLALIPRARLGLSGPPVVEMVRGRDELDAGDAAAVAMVYGAEARASGGQLELVPDGAEAIREWVATVAPGQPAFAERVEATQAALAARLVGRRDGRPAPEVQRITSALGLPRTPLPRRLAPIYARARAVDRHGWLWRMTDAPLWLARPAALATLCAEEVHALDAALLEHLGNERAATLFLVGDSCGHEISRAAEALGIAQYLAQHAAVVALLRSRGVRTLGLLTATGHSAVFFVNALQADRVYALPNARVVAMEPDVIARVTKQEGRRLRELIENDPLLGQPVRHFAGWGGIAEILPDVTPERLVALASS